MRTRKILSVILSLAMLLGAVNFVMPVSAAVKVDRAYSGSGEIEVVNNTDEAKVDVQGDIALVGGKTDDDVAGYLAVKGEKLTHGGGCYLPSIWWSTGPFNKKIAIAFDIMFASKDAKLHLENQTLDAEGNNSARNPFVFIGPKEGIERGGSITVVEYPENLPTSLTSNEWHNIAIEVLYNGTNKFNIYIDGEKYECGADADMYGVYRLRLNVVSGSMYIDNYRCLEGEQEDEIYPVADYAMQAASFTDSEKAALNAESGKIKILDSSLTVAELKAQLTAGEGESVAVFEDMTYKTVLADDAIVTQSAAVVVSNGKGAFRYLSFARANDSDFEIEPLADGSGCSVLGYKDTVTPPKDKITIPDYIAGYKVTEIGINAFRGVNIDSGVITMPDSVKVIGDNAFYDTYGTVNKLPAELEKIGANAFIHDIINEYAFPKKLKSIGNCAFKFAAIRNAISFNEGLESIAPNAFEWSQLKKFVLPDSVNSIGNEIIKTCVLISDLRFPRNEKVTKIPELWFTSKDVKSEGYMFKDMNIYIPETITEIPDDFLINFQDGATVTIYGVPGSAAEDFYKMVKDRLKESTYFNIGTYGTEGAYTDKDGDGKGELADIKFVEYDFVNNLANIIDETDINKGDILPTLYTQTAEPVFEAGYPGVGGKTADDVVLRLYSKNGGAGKNYINESGNGTKFVREISICVPESGASICYLGYFTDSQGTSYKNVLAYKVSNSGVYAFGNKICDARDGQWFNIVTVVDNGGSDKAAVYINGEKFETKLETGSYGVRHFRDSPDTTTDYVNTYYDNLRCYTTDKISYNFKADAPAKIESNSIDIKITDKGILYVYDDASYTVSELLSKLDVNESADANLRVYSDWSFKEELEADDVIGKGAVLVVAAKNGYSFERTYSYININPEVNRTIYDFQVISETDKTARVTGFFEENIIATDDLSAIRIPEKIMGYTITEIGNEAFYNDTRIQSVVIPDTVTKIGTKAFAGKSEDGKTYGTIKDVKLSKNLKEIANSAFSCNPYLTYIELPYGLETIGNSAFYWSGLKEISVPDTVTYLGLNNFRLCGDLRYVKLPGGVTSLDAGQFSAGVGLLTDLVIPESVTNIEEDVFGSYEMDLTVYGVKGSYAESWAAKYDFEFVGVIANTLLAAPKILGDGEKEISGTDYDIDYGFKTLTFDGKLINIGKADLEAMAAIALYDTEGRMVEMISKDITVPAGKNVEIKDYDVTIPAGKIADGYTVKGFVWRKSNIEPVSDALEILFDKNKREVHVLLIGNSFGNDSFEFTDDIAKADGVILKSQNMYIGSATLNVHYTNMLENAAKYQPVINGVYGKTLITMQEGLSSDKWNVVALQCGTHGFNYDDEFVDFAKEGSLAGDKFAYIKDYVSTYAPEATRVMHMSWGPCDEQSRELYGKRFADETLYPDASKAVFEAQKAAYEYGSTIFANEANMMVPTSYAVWYAIDELGFYEHSGPKGSDNKYSNPVSGTPSLFRDETCHLTTGTSPYGRVLASLTWYGYVTGNDVTECKYQHSGISEEDMAKLKIAAQWAIEQVTPVTGTAQ